MSRHIVSFVVLLAAVPLAATASDLPLRRVMLSTGGVGYFEYTADVDGPATLGLDVKLSQVDDVLASLVVFDSAGSVGTVELPGQDSTRAAFANAPFGPAALNSALDYLNSLQGVMLTVSGPRALTGRLLRAEHMERPAPPPAVPGHALSQTRVTLLTETGLQQFVLEDAESVQVADPALQAAITRVMVAIRAEPAQSAHHMMLHSNGAGHHTVRVGYVAAAPLWKTTYRLVLPANEAATARLQGWAVLENDSADDWQGIDLTLQYGNPVTFRQALYRAYYVNRPEVPVDMIGRIAPRVDGGAQPAMVAASAAAPAPVPRPAMRMADAAKPDEMAAPDETVTTAEAEEATVFHLPTPLTLPAGHTATVPILDRAMPAKRVSVVQQGHAHPVQALALRNDSGSSLPPGALTLYDTADAAAFAGNARLGGLPVGETRLLEFAEDLRTKVDWQTGSNVSLIGVTAAQGVLHVQQRDRWTARITVTAPASEGRHLLLEIQRRPDSTLVLESGLQAGEQTAQAWRVPVTLKPGESRVVVAHVDRVVREQSALLEDSGVLLQVLGEQTLAEPARAALRHIAELRAALATHEAERDRLNQQIATTEEDEDRLRKNLAAVAAGDSLRNRLTRALEADEDRIASLSAAAGKAEAAASQAREALAQAVQSLQL